MGLLNNITHFLHDHSLFLNESGCNTYKCDGCKLPGFGARYRCNACNFDMHQHCAASLPQVSSSLHPQHCMALVHFSGLGSRRFCDGCRKLVEGMFYRCGVCNFDLHPGCLAIASNQARSSQSGLDKPKKWKMTKDIGRALSGITLSVVAQAIGAEVVNDILNDS